MKEFLSQRRIPFVERNVATDSQAAVEMVRRSGQQGVPVTVVNEEIIVGFDQPRLEQALARAAAAPIHLGASIADAEPIARRRGAGPTSGAYIGSVKQGSLAARLDLRPDDVIIELAGRAIYNAEDLEAVMKKLQRGQKITLSFARNGQRRDVQFVP